MESNGQEDRIRGGTVRWDRERVRRTLLAYGRSPFNGDHFINGSWKMVLGIKTFRNGSPYSGSSISKTQNPWGGIRLLTGFVDMFLGIVASWFGREE